MNVGSATQIGQSPEPPTKPQQPGTFGPVGTHEPRSWDSDGDHPYEPGSSPYHRFNPAKLLIPTGKVKPGNPAPVGLRPQGSSLQTNQARGTEASAQTSLNGMIGNTLEGLPAAPQTYSARSQPTGWASLDSALAELAQQPWVEILGADPGCLMPGDLDEEMLQLESAPELDDKQFMLSSIGLQQYHQAKLTIRLRVLDFGTFQDWIARLHVPMILAGQVRWTVQMHPYPRPVLLFSLVFQYSLDRHLDFISAAILHSLRDCPL